MPPVPIELQRDATDCLVNQLRAWVPTHPGAALYLRPMVIATEPSLGAAPSSEHLYAIIAAPTGPYFPRGFATISVRVEDQHPRAVLGGVGAAKTGGNYAAGMLAKHRAKKEGFDEVMFLDALEHQLIEELSGMNVFVVEHGRRLVTPPTNGTILEGITRKSILELADSLELLTDERPLALRHVLEGIDSGRVTEMLAVGTAAVVTPVGRLTLGHATHTLGDGRPGPVAQKVYEALTDIQYGRTPDVRGWMHIVARQ